jgi:PleD family two-component response regulator
MENTTNNYDIPLRERNLAEEQQHSIKVKELLENIEKYKKKIIELTSQLDLLESLSAASKIAKVQDEVKKHCEICLEKDQNITQLKIEKEEEKIQYEQRLIKAEQKLEKLELESVTDPLTRLGNRAKFEKDLHNLIVSETQFSATVIDIDNFKQLNDTY